jgi:outer membrane protein OmpA-like peptidoglycan-associated protein
MRSINTLLLLLFSMSLSAQTWRANLYAGYVMGETIFSATDPKTGATNRINGGLHLATGLEYRKKEKRGYELLLFNQSTTVSDWYYQERGEGRTTNLRAQFNHLMFSAMNYGKIGNKVQPFGGLMAGVGFVNLKNPDNQISQFTPKAAWGLRGGLNLSSASSLKLRIYSNLLWTMKGIGGNFASNTSGNTITSGRPATMIQMQTGASVYYSFHKKEKKPAPAPKIKPVKEPKPEKVKPVKEPKPEKVKPVKEPKPEKVKPVKEPKPEKVKPVETPKPEKVKPVKEPKPEKAPRVKQDSAKQRDLFAWIPKQKPAEPEAPVYKPKPLSDPDQAFKDRKKILVEQLDLHTDNLELRIFDNGIIDDDTIALFINNQKIRSFYRLKSESLSLDYLAENLPDTIDIVMVAQNMGFIPPNTAVMEMVMNDKIYTLGLESTDSTSAMVRIINHRKKAKRAEMAAVEQRRRTDSIAVIRKDSLNKVVKIREMMDEQAVEISKIMPGAELVRNDMDINLFFSNGMMFKKNSFEISETYQRDVGKFKDVIDRFPGTKISVTGHTDDTGTDEINNKLSLKRAQAVYDLMIKTGVPPNRMTVIGYGKTRPRFPNDSEANRLKNRRVEIVITPER